jgi:hypothetical protein
VRVGRFVFTQPSPCSQCSSFTRRNVSRQTSFHTRHVEPHHAECGVKGGRPCSSPDNEGPGARMGALAGRDATATAGPAEEWFVHPPQ